MRLSSLQAATVLSVAGLVVVGCATPMPLVRLNPDARDVVWVGGRASVQKDTTGVRVAAAFEHQDGSNLALRVEIENRTTDRLEVSPQEMTFSVCSGLAPASCSPSQRVIDPEQVLTALAVAQSRGVADAANSQAFYGTLVLLNAVGDVASAAHGRPTTGSGTLVAASAMEGDAAARNSAQASIAAQAADLVRPGAPPQHAVSGAGRRRGWSICRSTTRRATSGCRSPLRGVCFPFTSPRW